MEARFNLRHNQTSVFALVFVWLAAITPACTGQKAVIYSPSPSPCDIKCEEITDPICHLAEYTYTGFPNLLGHTKQGYIKQYDHLIEILENCYDQSLEFLCGILTPHCVEDRGLLLPSKQMCLEFHDQCDEFLEEAGHSFLMDCHDLPEEENAPAVCIHFPTAAPGHTMPPEPTAVAACNAASAVSTDSTQIMLITSLIAIAFQLLFQRK